MDVDLKLKIDKQLQLKFIHQNHESFVKEKGITSKQFETSLDKHFCSMYDLEGVWRMRMMQPNNHFPKSIRFFLILSNL